MQEDVVTPLLALHAGETWQWSDPSAAAAPPAAGAALRVVALNVERGYKSAEISAWLRSLSPAPDVLLLQEVDVGCARTARANVAVDIARACGMPHVALAVEFEELASPLRSARLAGGGVHCNAVVSRRPLGACGSLVFGHQPYDWSWRGALMRQPRRGARGCCWADVEAEGPGGRRTTLLRAYSTHLESFTGAAGRLRQMADVWRHARETTAAPCVAGGDLNTLMHGVMRFVPLAYPTADWLRLRTLGESEAQWWQRCVLSCPRAEEARRAVGDGSLDCLAECHADDWQDPFDKGGPEGVTRTGRFWAAKLDWLLSRGLAIQAHSVGPSDLSDHRPIVVDYQLPGDETAR
eukprot:m51a1_g11958 hypothetical protein (351) ;mRNA; r:790890-791942